MGVTKEILITLLVLCCCLKVSYQVEFNVHDLKVRSFLQALSSHNDTSIKLKELITRTVQNKENINPDSKEKVNKEEVLTEELKKTILEELDLLGDKGKSFFGAFEEGLEKLACNFGITRFCGGTNNNSTVDDNEPSMDLPSTSTQKPEGTDSGKTNKTIVSTGAVASEDDSDDGEGTLIDSQTTTTEKTMDDIQTTTEDIPNDISSLPQVNKTTSEAPVASGNETIVEFVAPTMEDASEDDFDDGEGILIDSQTTTTEKAMNAIPSLPQANQTTSETPAIIGNGTIPESTAPTLEESLPMVEETPAFTTTTEKQTVTSTQESPILNDSATNTSALMAVVPDTSEDDFDDGEGILIDSQTTTTEKAMNDIHSLAQANIITSETPPVIVNEPIPESIAPTLEESLPLVEETPAFTSTTEKQTVSSIINPPIVENVAPVSTYNTGTGESQNQTTTTSAIPVVGTDAESEQNDEGGLEQDIELVEQAQHLTNVSNIATESQKNSSEESTEKNSAESDEKPMSQTVEQVNTPSPNQDATAKPITDHSLESEESVEDHDDHHSGGFTLPPETSSTSELNSTEEPTTQAP